MKEVSSIYNFPAQPGPLKSFFCLTISNSTDY